MKIKFNIVILFTYFLVKKQQQKMPKDLNKTKVTCADLLKFDCD